MNAEVSRELLFWLIYLSAGVVITFCYDLLRILRRVIKHGSGMIAFEDMIFWILTTIALFRLIYQLGNGILRWFAVLGLFCGMLIYKKIFSETFVCFMSTIINKLLHLVVGLLKPLLKLVKRVFSKGFKRVSVFWMLQKKRLTGNIKKGNIDLCKHFCVKEHKKKTEKTNETQDEEKETAEQL